MRKIFGLMLFCITNTYAQDEYLDVVPYSYSFNEIGISPSEQIWIANSSGNTYHTNKFDSKWQHGPFGTTLDEIRGNAERVTFFSDNVMIISGLLNEYPSGDGWIYRSEDGGLTWNTIKYGGDDWLDAIYAHGNKVWMSGSSNYIFYTEDTGITWKRFNAVAGFDDFRVQTIHFSSDDNTGIFSSYEGNIAITKDNCKTWENIPTPLSQEKIKNVYNTRPDIDKVRILGENYIVSQLNNVLITNASTIDWKLLPDAIDFEVTENGNLYIINKDKSIKLTDRNFNTIWQSSEKLMDYPSIISVKNENLFIYTNKHIYKINKNEFNEAITLLEGTTIEEPDLQLKYNDELLGFDENAIFKLDLINNKWYRYMETNIRYIADASVLDGELIINNPVTKQSYLVDLQNKTTSLYDFPQKLFEKKKVMKFSVESGSRGCFHDSAKNREYIINGNNFIHANKEVQNDVFKKMDNTIDTGLIISIINEIDISRTKNVTITDLGITSENIKNFKKIVDKEQKERFKTSDSSIPPSMERLYNFDSNADYDFYKNTADTIFKISPETIEKALKKDYGIMSTTVNWQKLAIEFQDGTYLSIQNSDYVPGYYYTPWQINYNGLLFETTSIKLGEMINELTKGSLLDKKIMAKEYAIFKITDYLYDKSLGREQ